MKKIGNEESFSIHNSSYQGKFIEKKSCNLIKRALLMKELSR